MTAQASATRSSLQQVLRTEVKVDGEESVTHRVRADILAVGEDCFPFQLSLHYKGAIYYGKADRQGETPARHCALVTHTRLTPS